MTTLEQRKKLMALLNEGMKAPQIAKELQISVHTVRKWAQRLKKGAPYIRPWGGLVGVL